MKSEEFVACICEGNAENAIIDLLLDNNLLSFSRENMLENEVWVYRMRFWVNNIEIENSYWIWDFTCGGKSNHVVALNLLMVFDLSIQ